MATTQERFKEALDRLAGAVITPQVAEALLYAFSEPPDHSIDLSLFDVEQHGDCEFKAERFADLIDELHPLHEAQWRETEMHRHGLPFNPDYEAGRRFEKAGTLVQFTVRRGGELIGHMRMYLQRSVHTQTLFASEDTIFVKPEHRDGLLGLALVRYVERQVQRAGAREIRFDTKSSNRADAILRRLRYEPVATRWVKVLKE